MRKAPEREGKASSLRKKKRPRNADSGNADSALHEVSAEKSLSLFPLAFPLRLPKRSPFPTFCHLRNLKEWGRRRKRSRPRSRAPPELRPRGSPSFRASKEARFRDAQSLAGEKALAQPSPNRFPAPKAEPRKRGQRGSRANTYFLRGVAPFARFLPLQL